VSDSPVLHTLKTWPEPFQAVFDGSKTAELRDGRDRDFKVGDVLLLQEFDPKERVYTGCEIHVEVTYIQTGFGLPDGLVMLSFRPARGICRVCGCTDEEACEGGCTWVEPDLCSSCVEKEEAQL